MSIQEVKDENGDKHWVVDITEAVSRIAQEANAEHSLGVTEAQVREFLEDHPGLLGQLISWGVNDTVVRDTLHAEWESRVRRAVAA